MASKKMKPVKVEHVRISIEKPNATVKFKPLDKDGKVVRATMRGEPPIFIKQVEDNGWNAGVRGDSPVTARTPDKAFAKAVTQHWA